MILLKFQNVFLTLLVNTFLLSTSLATTTGWPKPTTPLPPQVEISLSIVKVELRQPFTITCKISHLLNNANQYFVRFFSSKNGLLASYEQSENSNQPFIIAEIHSDVHVSFGDHSKYPLFDLQVEELVNSEQHYWCSLELSKGGNLQSTVYNSSVWEHISLEFSKLPNLPQNKAVFNGRCTLSHFIPTNRTYNVQFHMYDVGHLQLLVANYSVVADDNGNQKPEMFYVHSHSQYWSGVVPGPSRTFPHFDITVFPPKNGTVHFEDKKWWCEVGVGVDGQNGYVLFKSNVLSEKVQVSTQKTTSKKH